MPGPPLTILLVRDGADAPVAWDALRSAGDVVVAADTPNLALDLALQHKPDVVVLDLTQTSVNQFALARVIRATVAPTTPIVMLTASIGHSVHDEESVIDLVLRPPVEIELLGGLLRLLHKQRRGASTDV